MRYERTDEGGYVAVVDEGETAQRGYECAAWYQTLALEPGTYDVEPVTIRGTAVPDGQRPYYGKVTIPCREVYDFFPSLFGGVATGGGRIGECDRAGSYTVSPYWYVLEGLEGRNVTLR